MLDYISSTVLSGILTRHGRDQSWNGRNERHAVEYEGRPRRQRLLSAVKVEVEERAEDYARQRQQEESKEHVLESRSAPVHGVAAVSSVDFLGARKNGYDVLVQYVPSSRWLANGLQRSERL